MTMGSIHFLTGYTFAGFVRGVNRSGESLELELYQSETVPNYYVVYGGFNQDGVITYNVCWEKPGEVCGRGYNATVELKNQTGDNLFYLYILGASGEQLPSAGVPKEKHLREEDAPDNKDGLVLVKIDTYFGQNVWYQMPMMRVADAKALGSLDSKAFNRVIKEYFCPDDPEFSGASMVVLPLPDDGKKRRYLEFC